MPCYCSKSSNERNKKQETGNRTKLLASTFFLQVERKRTRRLRHVDFWTQTKSLPSLTSRLSRKAFPHCFQSPVEGGRKADGTLALSPDSDEGHSHAGVSPQSKYRTLLLPLPNRSTGPCCCLCPIEGQDFASARAQSKDRTSPLPGPNRKT